jgi:hypothetical protein
MVARVQSNQRITDMERISVRLLQYYGGVNAGEIAGYVPEVAARLIEQGFAEAYVPDDETEESGETETLTAADRKALAKAAMATLPAQGEGA